MDPVVELLKILNPGDTVYTILRHTSRSGMYRVISLMIIKDNEPLIIDNLAAPLLEGYDNRHSGCRASGYGMSTGFHLVYRLSSKLFDNGYALNHRWL